MKILSNPYLFGLSILFGEAGINVLLKLFGLPNAKGLSFILALVLAFYYTSKTNVKLSKQFRIKIVATWTIPVLVVLMVGVPGIFSSGYSMSAIAFLVAFFSVTIYFALYLGSSQALKAHALRLKKEGLSKQSSAQ